MCFSIERSSWLLLERFCLHKCGIHHETFRGISRCCSRFSRKRWYSHRVYSHLYNLFWQRAMLNFECRTGLAINWRVNVVVAKSTDKIQKWFVICSPRISILMSFCAHGREGNDFWVWVYFVWRTFSAVFVPHEMTHFRASQLGCMFFAAAKLKC